MTFLFPAMWFSYLTYWWAMSKNIKETERRESVATAPADDAHDSNLHFSNESACGCTELVHHRPHRWYLPAHLAHKPERGEEGLRSFSPAAYL